MDRPPFTPKLSAAAVMRPGRASGWACDDRARVVDSARLYLVADGSGPTYGGYYAPIALDPALDAIAAALAPERHASHACSDACVRDAFASANDLMWAAQDAHTHAFEDELGADPGDRLQASLRACQRVALERFGRAIDTFMHAAGSITALYFQGDRALVGQVGLCRAYLCRRGVVELLLPDDGVWKKRPDLGDDLHYGIATQLLGFGPAVNVGTRVVACEPGDRFVLCSDGAWSVASDDAIEAACRHARAEDTAAAIAAAVEPMRDDAAVVAVTVV